MFALGFLAGAGTVFAVVMVLAAVIRSGQISRQEEQHPWQPRAPMRVVR